MKNAIIFLSIFIFFSGLSAQDPIESFDGAITEFQDLWLSGNGTLDLSYDSTLAGHEGAACLEAKWKIDVVEWGGGISFGHYTASNEVIDLSARDTLSLWYYVKVPGKLDSVDLTLILRDQPSASAYAADNQNVEFWVHDVHGVYTNTEPGWHEIVIPLYEAEDAFAGFVYGGNSVENNHKLDPAAIRGWYLEWGTWNTLAVNTVDSGVVCFDNMQARGSRETPIILFNGKFVPSNYQAITGWSGSVEVTDEADYDTGTNSLKWTGGDGWDGVWFTFTEPRKLGSLWSHDSLQFAIKAEPGLGNLWLAFTDTDEDSEGTADRQYQAVYYLTETEAGYDGAWKLIKIALRDFNSHWTSWDGDQVEGQFDSTKVGMFRIEGDGQELSGRIVYLDNIWTGHPEFDWTPPVAVPGVTAFTDDYYNLVAWEAVPGESGEIYSLYNSDQPISDIASPAVDNLVVAISEDMPTGYAHWLYYPLVDHQVTQYYAVTATDESGNIGPAGVSGAISNKAKGIPTISLNPPANFTADGDLSEWDQSGIKPWVITPEKSHVAVGWVTDSLDLKATAYLAIDKNYLYVAIDVVDDAYFYDPTGYYWEMDALELFIGLYNWRGKRHTSIERGAEPDYFLLFLKDNVTNGYNNEQIIYSVEHPNYHFETLNDRDYVIEAKIPLDTLAFGDDVKINPVNGMRIPLDFYFHDNDGSGWEGNLAWSRNNTDQAGKNPLEWAYTWIGDTTHVTAVGQSAEPVLVASYFLSQNYPNPFNPTTTISYALPQAGQVKIELYNTLGQKVRALLNEYKTTGSYTVDLKAGDLPSGIYLYKMEVGKFTKTMKMVLMK